MLYLALLPIALATDTWTTPHPGVDLLHRTTGDPLEIYVLKVDLCARGVSMRATRAEEHQQTVSSFGADVGAQAAINGDFFSYDTYYPTGFAMGAGSHWNPDNDWEGFVAFGTDHAQIRPEGEVWSTPAAWMWDAVSGYPLLVSEGVAGTSFSSPSHCSSLNPRTAVGLSQDRQTLFMAVVDGRSSASEGVTCPALATLMRDLGAWTALNLDGGGSSDLWVSGLGVSNDPSDGSERVVANHLAVWAAGTGTPTSCDFWQDEVLTDAGILDGGSTDVNGDGRADACARSSAGFTCHLSDGEGGWSGQWSVDELSDTNGWADPSNYGTIRMGDVDGDGLSDLCARADAGVLCWPGRDPTARITGPALSDDSGWSALPYASTLRLGDVDGDGRQDLCARAAAGIQCWPSTGTGFGEAIPGPGFDDAGGWDEPDHYGTLRMGDIDGDGRDDLCARGHAGQWCHLSQGTSFSDPIPSPAWSDEAGWSDVMYWSTIRLTDLDGDGRHDLCGRGPLGVECYLSEGTAFSSTAIQVPDLADDVGWTAHRYYSTLRMGDVDADGDQDLCVRGAAGVWCHLFEDGAFPRILVGPALSDAEGWTDFRYTSSLRLADVDGSGTADLCARGPDGFRCTLSDGAAFSTETALLPWTDADGWDQEPTLSTLRVGGGRAADASDSAWDDLHRGVEEKGCGCATSPRGLGAWPAFFLCFLVRRRRRPGAAR